MGSLNKGFVDGTIDEAAKHAALSALSIPEIKNALSDVLVHELNNGGNPLTAITENKQFESANLSASSRIDFSLNEYAKAISNDKMVSNLITPTEDMMKSMHQEIGTNDLISKLTDQEMKIQIQKTALSVCMDAHNLRLDIDKDLVDYHIEQNIEYPLELMNDKQFKLGAAIAANVQLTNEMVNESPAEFSVLAKQSMDSNNTNSIGVFDSMLLKADAIQNKVEIPASFEHHKESLNAIAEISNSSGLRVNVSLPKDMESLNTNLERAGIDPSSQTFQEAVKEQVADIATVVNQKIEAKQPQVDIMAAVDNHKTIDTSTNIEQHIPTMKP